MICGLAWLPGNDPGDHFAKRGAEPCLQTASEAFSKPPRIFLFGSRRPETRTELTQFSGLNGEQVTLISQFTLLQ